MKVTVFVFLVIATVNLVQAQILGELQGAATYKVESRDESNTSGYESECKLAMNIDVTSSTFSIPYSFYHCGGMDIWNESVSVGIKDNKVYSLHENGNLNKEIGKIEADGTIMFTISQIDYKKFVEIEPSWDCSIRNGFPISKKFTLNNTWTFIVKKLNTNNYEVLRKSNIESVVTVNKRKWNCNYNSYIKRTTVTDLVGTVSK